MRKLIILEEISLAFGLDPLLDHIKLQITSGERVCLIGRNGTGKSSLLKIIENKTQPDSGTIWRKPNIRIARLEQELPKDSIKTVYEFVAEGLSEAGDLLAEYHATTHKLAKHHSQKHLNKLEELQNKIEAIGAWHFEQEVTNILLKLELNPDTNISTLSGGWQRRAALAKALVCNPDLLLLDEPTNHLDIDAIQWLEDFLLESNVSLVFITHDRSLLQRLATRIIELDRGILTSWPGNYEKFLLSKEQLLHSESRMNAEFDKKLAIEEKWIRQGIKARRTRNEGRVRALEDMRKKRTERRTIEGKASFTVNDAKKSGQLVIDAKNISHQFNTKKIIDNFSLRMLRGDKIGLIGPNGVGKSTLLNILLGKISPQKGTVTTGTKLEVAYFDQLRTTIDFNKTVMDNISEGSDNININGKDIHVISYLKDFLFTPKRALTPTKNLSGGECNRLVLARLFSKSSNLLVMDEPTNDLDIETLELLEELLIEYKGSLLLVSHDRKFLDNVVTSSLVFLGEGKIEEHIGGYQDWFTHKKSKQQDKATPTKIKQIQTKKNIKLSFQQQKELKQLPNKIEKLEATLSIQQELITKPDFYSKPSDVVENELEKLKQINTEIELAYKLWDELESKK